jgi:hypothetical protein
MTRARWLLSLSGAILSAISLASAPSADACGMRMSLEDEEDRTMQLVHNGALQLEDGKPELALQTLEPFWYVSSSTDWNEGQAAVRRRGERLMARAIAVSGGDAFPGRGESTYVTTESRLQFAVQRLELLDMSSPDDPQILTDLGVAMAKSKASQRRARGVLESLAERDLMTSAHGWAALAKLRNEAASKAEAMRRCRLMTRRPAEVCDGKPRQPTARPSRTMDSGV